MLVVMAAELTGCGCGVQLVGGEGVTEQDALFVRARLEAIAKASVHGAYNSRMTADPDLVSKAVFDWWWQHRGNRKRIPPYRPAAWGRSDAQAGRHGVSPVARRSSASNQQQPVCCLVQYARAGRLEGRVRERGCGARGLLGVRVAML